MEDGRPLDPAYVTRLFQKLRKQSEPLPELTFHGLRHTAASLMLAGGADISRVSNLLAMRRFRSLRTCTRTWSQLSARRPCTVPQI